MKTSHLFFTALLGLGLSSAACAQTTVPGAPMPSTPMSPMTPGAAGAIVPGQPGVTGMPVTGSPTPVGTAPSTIYAPGTAPAGTPGTLQGTQPVGTAPARTIRRSPTGARTGTNTNGATVRP